MKEHGILFTAPMVRALLAGTKTQTRRILKPQPRTVVDLGAFVDAAFWDLKEVREADGHVSSDRHWRRKAPHAKGQILWVRETFAVPPGSTEAKEAVYRADLEEAHARTLEWTPSIHMPRWASRITLEVTGVRLERVQAISEEDARAEGMSLGEIPADDYGPTRVGWTFQTDDGKCLLQPTAREAYAKGWDEINGAGSWASNPWTWAYDFRRIS